MIKHSFPRLLAALFLLSFTGCDNPFSSSGSGSGPKGPITVVTLGDSNTGSVIYPGVAPWPSRLANQEPEWEVINAGRGGEKSGGGAARVSGLLDRYNPDVLTVMYGANNAIQGDTGNFRSEMRAIIREAKSRDIPVVVGNILPMSGNFARFEGEVNRLNRVLEGLAFEEQVRLVDLHREFRGEAATERFPDGLHPDEDGTRIIAVAMREGIRKVAR